MRFDIIHPTWNFINYVYLVCEYCFNKLTEHSVIMIGPDQNDITKIKSA